MKLAKIKLLFVIDRLLPGGTENQLIWLSENLPRHSFYPVILILENNDYQNNLNLKTPIHIFKYVFPSYTKNIEIWYKICQFIRNHNFDIVQTHFVDSEINTMFGYLFSRKKPILISTRRNLYHWIKDAPLKFRLAKFLVKYTSKVLVNSYSAKSACKNLENISSKNIFVIQNSVETDKYIYNSTSVSKRLSGLDYNFPIIGVVSNWRPVKGLSVFLKAAKIVHSEIPEATFVLIGHGPQETELKSLSVSMGIAHKVVFIRNPPDVPHLISSFDIAVQPSFSESFSNSLIEYMAAAKPIVATSVGDAERIIQNGYEGLIVKPNDFYKMAEAIISICRDISTGRQMGKKAREKVLSNWTPEIILNKYISFYNSLV